MDRDGGSGPKTELDLTAAAAAAVEATRGATERDVSLAAQAALEAVRGATELDLSAVAAAAVASVRSTEPPPIVEHKTVIGPPTDTGVAAPRKSRPNAFAPTAAYSELTADAAQPPAAELEELPEGTLLDNRYHIKELVGQGGMGAVYAAHDDDLDEDIALKVLRPDLASDTDFQRRLKAEVRLARRVSHPNVCRVHDLGVDDELVFVTMELVRGHTVRERLAEIHAGHAEPFELAQITDIIVQIGAALSAAHRAGVIHRDVKPDNVILAGGRAVLTDFGVASLVVDRARAIVGTPAYLAPEVLRGEASDHRVDVYAVAALAYELITGAPPFGARTIEVALELARKPPPYPALPAAFGTPLLRASLDRVLSRGLAADPMLRAPTIERFTDAFAHAARGAPASSGLRATARPGTEDMATPVSIVRRAELRVTTTLAWFSMRTARDTEDAERIVVDAGGTPIRVETGEILALFGASRSTGDDADRAAHAALDIVARFGGRVGLDTTRILLRSTDNELAGPDTAAAAAALAHDARDGEVWASETTSRQLAARFELVATAGTARRVTRARATTTTDAAIDSVRITEVTEICAHVERAFRERAPVFVEVRGSAGSGKTRVRKAVVAAIAARRDVECLVAVPSPVGEAAPLSLVQTCSREWFEAASGGGAIVDPVARSVAARRWLETRAIHRPIVIVVEDVQWIDPTSRALLDELRGSLERLPIAVLTFVRGEQAAAPAGDGATVWLAPLDDDRATALVRAIAPDARANDISAIVARAGGHPFFIEELAREVAAGAAPVALPTTVEAIVQSHLDSLPELATQVAMCAAVIGTGFWRRALLHVVAGTSIAALDDTLASLERARVVARAPSTVFDDDYYVFTSSLVRDSAYARIPARDRRQLHAAIATWLDDQPHAADQKASWLSAIAHHRKHAGDAVRAALAYRQAGTHCLGMSAYGEAAAALRKAAALATVPDPVLDEALADAVAQTEGHEAAEPIFQRALEETDDADAISRARLWCKLGEAARHRGTAANAIARFNAGLAIAAPGGRLASWAAADPRTAAQLWAGLGATLGALGRVDEAHPYCERAVAALEGTAFRRDLAHALAALAESHLRACRFAEQRRCIERQLAIARDLEDSRLQLSAYLALGVVHGVLGDLDRAVAATQAALELGGRLELAAASARAASVLAGLYVDLGRLDDAEGLLDEVISTCDGTPDQHHVCTALVHRARALAVRGDLVRARADADRALAMARTLDRPLDAAIALRIVASLASRAGDHDGARSRIEEALVHAVVHDELEGLRTRAARARILANAGDPNAADELADVRHDLTQLGVRHEVAVLDDLGQVR